MDRLKLLSAEFMFMRPPAPPPKKFTIKEPGELLAWLAANVPGLTRTEAKSLLRHGAIRVNGETAARHDVALKAGDKVEVSNAAAGRAAARPLPFPILFEDDHLVVIDKPSGLLTVGTETEKQRTAHRLLGERERARGNPLGRVFVVHRLDRETSGIVIFAKTEQAKRKLQDKWDSVEKEYFAVVEGVPSPEEGTLVHWLQEDQGGFRVHASEEKNRFGEKATTHYRVVSKRDRRALLHVRIDTGKKHQIRVQLAAIKTPVVGDERYGTGRKAPRLGLHATKITFKHPATGKMLTVESPLPAVLQKLVGQQD